MANQQRISIDKQLRDAWNYLYTIEVDDDITEEMMLAYLEQAGEYIAALNNRKRLNADQRERLVHLEKWYRAYDINGLRKNVEKRRLIEKMGLLIRK